MHGFFSCNRKDKNPKDVKPYNGPTAVMNEVNMLFSDSAIVKVQLIAPVQNEYLNGNRTFPKGVLIYFYDNDGTLNSSLSGNQGKFDKEKNLYTVKGDVIITGIKEYKKLNTEELHWNPITKKVFTDKFVRIETKEEILTGNGLDASQDFKQYAIRNVTGIFAVKDL